MELSDASPFLQMFVEKKRQILIGAAAVIGGAAILIGYFQSGPDALSYARAEAAFAKWEASPDDEALYRKVKEAIQLAPALGKKYEAATAQKLLNNNQTEEGLAIAERSVSRVQQEAPFHSHFARTSLLIEQENYQQALENAVALKELLPQSTSPLLYAHNLLRIACLQRELKNRPGEKAAWEELESFLQTGKQVANLVLGSFSEKQLDLTQFIAERKSSL